MTGPNGAACCASIFRRFTIAIRPARASWSRSFISRGFRPSRRIALPIGCCKGPQGSGALSAKPLVQHFPDGYQSGSTHRQGYLPRSCHRACGRRDGRYRRQRIHPAWRDAWRHRQGGADRHPKIANGVMIGAGAKILGNIEIGSCSRIAAGSVVLKPVLPKTTVAGVPARVVERQGVPNPRA